MIKSALTAFSLLGLSSAQSTVSLFLPDTDPQSLVASIKGSDAKATTYVIQCPPGTDQNNCGYPSPVEVIEGLSTLQLAITEPNFTYSVACSLGGTTQAVCTSSAAGSEANFPGISTTTLSASEITFLPVVVTAGATGDSKSISGSAASTTSKSAGSTATLSSASQGTGSAVASSRTTGGLPQITPKAQWAIGGAAVVLAAAAI